MTRLKESGLLDKIAMVFGQMGENSASRSHAVYSGLTLAEYLRDEKNQDVLLFIVNFTVLFGLFRDQRRAEPYADREWLSGNSGF